MLAIALSLAFCVCAVVKKLEMRGKSVYIYTQRNIRLVKSFHEDFIMKFLPL